MVLQHLRNAVRDEVRHIRRVEAVEQTMLSLNSMVCPWQRQVCNEATANYQKNKLHPRILPRDSVRTPELSLPVHRIEV